MNWKILVVVLVGFLYSPILNAAQTPPSFTSPQGQLIHFHNMIFDDYSTGSHHHIDEAPTKK